MSASVHDKLERVRKPRVHITYQVETEGAELVQELPFVVGVLGDFAGDPDPAKPPKPLSQREFVKVDRDNFDAVMASLSPRLDLKVENTLKGDGTEIGVNLTFRSMEDFEPERVARQVPALAALLETRAKLRELQSKADRSEDLESLLEKVLTSQEQLQTLSSALGIEKPGSEG
ncbi:type VI secretion system contractile sheath small subunit [Paracraurococcus lichenis]|uniref:Type VI secretion system contractile sheath small subunit n=1 Tax=Paracraurococcus lichenis TaxID=3064888 RepID=A0ABT9E9R8_9PROT|nr:type VI secretion system contractile sheath small subunit [Paracraurococcus sp. LOR1-02]MDO9712941.1 type VI secretion system contractile sheath small subunit [Paracraurococcus sp. LOR1-02]